jgi:hypothetical protein
MALSVRLLIKYITYTSEKACVYGNNRGSCDRNIAAVLTSLKPPTFHCISTHVPS